MMNASYNGLVKIGKTTKDPQERAKELSAATGVATPFIVVYKKEFKNCHVAERMVHAILEEQGYRVNPSREFFNIDITGAINIIMSIPNESSGEFIDGNIEDNSSEDNLAEIFYNKANDYYWGTDDIFQDEDLALEYFEKSASFGKAEAYIKIGDIWKRRGNMRQAYISYKNGADNGCQLCYVKLGEIYNDKDSVFFNKNNAKLAYKKYFKYIDNESKHLDKDFIFKHMEIGLVIDHLIAIGNDDILFEHEKTIVKYTSQYRAYFEETVGLFYEKDLALAQFYERKCRPFIDKLNEYGDELGLAKKYFNRAKEYFKSIENFDNLTNYQELEINALDLFTKSAELGYQISNVYIGIYWLYKGYDLSIYNADKSWKTFYNYAYHTFLKQHDLITKDQKDELCFGFTILISYALKFNTKELIHEYYVHLALNLGIIDYYTKRINELSEWYYNLNENLESNRSGMYNVILDYSELEIEKNQLVNVHSFIKNYMIEYIDKNGEQAKINLQPLDTEFCKYRI